MGVAASPEVLELVTRLRQGDESALGGLIAATQRWAFRLARSMLRDEDQCKDVLQESYLAVYQEIGSLRDVAAFQTWFSRIVLNRCRRVLRQKTTESIDDVTEPSVAGGQGGVDDREDLRRALAVLTEIDRSVLMLREVMQLSYDEIATTLSVPVGTVRSRLSEARRRLVEAWHGGRGSGTTTKRTTTVDGTAERHVSVRDTLQRVWTWLFPPRLSWGASR